MGSHHQKNDLNKPSVGHVGNSVSAITTTTTPQAAHNGAIDDIKDAANETCVSFLPGGLHPDVLVHISISGQAGDSSHKLAEVILLHTLLTTYTAYYLHSLQAQGS